MKTVDDILIPVANEYKDIYANPAKNGVYLHSIEELAFEGIDIHPNGKCVLYVGS